MALHGGLPHRAGCGGGRVSVQDTNRKMKTKPHKEIYHVPVTMDELITDMELNPERYKHLQFILNRQNHLGLGLGQLYLVVNETGFGVYRLDDVDYENSIIQLSFTNLMTGYCAEISLDIINKHPQLFLINWLDIEDMVYKGVVYDFTDNELHELESELP